MTPRGTKTLRLWTHVKPTHLLARDQHRVCKPCSRKYFAAWRLPSNDGPVHSYKHIYICMYVYIYILYMYLYLK